ncbi:hypothetical protein DBR11_26495 [Pedobacter sp. HMWF019]|uniref:hypothetical protein n=1 Tax=Pedobacter sp. HMWF019 TaxID=2056856 RepID=UPI000D37BEFD|nr:hypothetical protein [Pedobacter sp. HMWF019]PTS92668.1 hypothetical protein DBR11_26495 [Pedobacter sp. HMWF019]
MQAHLNQALHNENFVAECCNNYPDNYFDWKVTATFYTALHLLRAFCEKREVDPGNTHYDIANSFDPRRCNNRPITQVPNFLWRSYSQIQKYSEQARYDVFLDHEVENEIQRENFKHCLILLKGLRDYFSQQGVPCVSEDAA